MPIYLVCNLPLSLVWKILLKVQHCYPEGAFLFRSGAVLCIEIRNLSPRLKNSIFLTGIEIAKRDWKFQASHPQRPYFLWGDSEGQDWKCQAKLKFPCEIENFSRSFLIRALNFSGLFQRKWSINICASVQNTNNMVWPVTLLALSDTPSSIYVDAVFRRGRWAPQRVKRGCRRLPTKERKGEDHSKKGIRFPRHTFGH